MATYKVRWVDIAGNYWCRSFASRAGAERFATFIGGTVK